MGEDPGEQADEPLSEPVELTDQQINRALVEIFDDVAATQQRVESGSLFDAVQPRSSLAADDKATDPYQLSHGVITVVGVAVDHLHALRSLLVEAKALNPYAPFTITRAAIEAASTAVWLLKPNNRAERVIRRCQQMSQDGYDSHNAITELGLEPREDPKTRHARLTELARAAANDPTLELSRLRTVDIVREADAATAGNIRVLGAWRICAGFSHARPWPILSVLQREEHDAPDPHVINARVTSSLQSVLWAVMAAHKVAIAAASLYEQRRVPHY